MARKRMVRPVEIDVEVTGAAQEPVRKRRTSHGIVCGCGSEEVEVTNTVTHTHRPYPAFLNGRRYLSRKRRCVCAACGREWWERVDVEEKRRGE